MFEFQVPGSEFGVGGLVSQIWGGGVSVTSLGLRVQRYVEATEFERLRVSGSGLRTLEGFGVASTEFEAEESQLVERVIGCSSFSFRVPSWGLGD